jgi:hypothetical protein
MATPGKTGNRRPAGPGTRGVVVPQTYRAPGTPCAHTKVVLDGQSIRYLRQDQIREFDVAPGAHSLRISMITYRSNSIDLDTGDGGSMEEIMSRDFDAQDCRAPRSSPS